MGLSRLALRGMHLWYRFRAHVEALSDEQWEAVAAFLREELERGV